MDPVSAGINHPVRGDIPDTGPDAAVGWLLDRIRAMAYLDLTDGPSPPGHWAYLSLCLVMDSPAFNRAGDFFWEIVCGKDRAERAEQANDRQRV